MGLQQPPEETTPLLHDGPHPDPVPHKHPKRTVALLAITILCLAGAGSLCRVPVTRLLEDVLCHRYYEGVNGGDDKIDERLCKVDHVQSELAYYMGILSMIEAIIGLTVALPYGVLADKTGRRFVLVLSSLGTIFSNVWMMIVLRFWRQIPIQLFLLSHVFEIVGGGESVVLAMLYSIAADAVPDAERVTAFSRMAVAAYSAGVIGSLASARLMQAGFLWTPVWISIVLIAFSMTLIIYLPEGEHSKKNDESRHSTALEKQSLLSTIRKHISESFSRFKNSLFIFNSTSAILVLLVFSCHTTVTQSAGQLFVQYVSKRFGWSLAEAGYLLSVRGVTSMFVLLVGLPFLGKVLTSSSMSVPMSPARKDLVLARLSAFVLTTGALLMAGHVMPIVITGQVILTLGDGLVSLCRSIITSFVDKEHFSTVYTLISMVETMGSLGAGPMLALLFSTGMKLGGLWLGLPYYCLAMVGVVNFTLLLLTRLPQEPRGDDIQVDRTDGESDPQDTEGQ